MNTACRLAKLRECRRGCDDAGNDRRRQCANDQSKVQNPPPGGEGTALLYREKLRIFFIN